jgi:hypothetical protein
MWYVSGLHGEPVRQPPTTFTDRESAIVWIDESLSGAVRLPPDDDFGTAEFEWSGLTIFVGEV